MSSPSVDRRLGLTGNKAYKAPCDVATTANITLSGEQTIDGVTTSSSRVLVWNQSNTVDNGIWDTSTGSWSRAVDCNTNQDIAKGTQVLVTGGTSYAGQIFEFTSANPIIPGTSAITIVRGISSSTLEARLASTASAADGGGLVKATHALNYAADTVGGKYRRTVFADDAPFFAVGDGVTDDYAALQAALNFLNPNVWAASFNYQQGGGTLRLSRKVYRITQPLKIPPFVTIEGDGPDGWTGGGAGIGLTSGTSPANGSAIFADFGATTETCAIDTQNWSVGGGTLYAATNMTPILVAQLGGTYTYCQGVGLRNLAVFCTNLTRLGIRFQGAALSKIDNVSIIGFKNAFLSNCVWSTQYRNIFSLSYQTGLSMITNNDVEVSGVFDLMGWGSSNGSVITNNNIVTAGNKPAWWSANDTNYNGTSLYIQSCFGIRFARATAQHCGRVWWVEAADVSFGQLYIEDLPFLGSGDTPGAFNGYNAAASNFAVLIEHLHCDSNGVTLLNNATNLPVTLLCMSGIQGNTLGATISGTTNIVLGNNVNRNGAFGDFAFNSKIFSLIPTSGTWTPSLTNITGTGVTAAGFWLRRGNVYDVTVVITGTGITATGGGASLISTPFNGTGGFAAPARTSAASVSTANVQAASGLMDTNANLYISAITSTTRIVVSCQMYGV